MNKNPLFLFLIINLFLILVPVFISAQTNERVFSRRLSWQEDENVYRYAVEIDKMENGTFRRHLSEFTAASYINVSLPEGEYRYRIIPHDILDRPTRGTQWIRFEVYPTETEQKNESGELYARYHTIGICAGSSFIDPVIAATIHGSFSPLKYFFIQAGVDIGFISTFEEVDNYYSLYPFLNIGFFLPLNANAGFYTGVGIGFQYSSYTVLNETVDISIFVFNAAVGMVLWDMINVQYTIKTNFTGVNHLVSIGYVYRFKERL